MGEICNYVIIPKIKGIIRNKSMGQQTKTEHSRTCIQWTTTQQQNYLKCSITKKYQTVIRNPHLKENTPHHLVYMKPKPSKTTYSNSNRTKVLRGQGQGLCRRTFRSHEMFCLYECVTQVIYLFKFFRLNVHSL